MPKMKMNIIIIKYQINNALFMRYLKAILYFVPLLLSHHYMHSQDKKDIELLNNLFEPQVHRIDYKQYIQNNTNELHWIASGLFLFYKSFFSSQDGNRCVFHPSCSAYTIHSIKKKGLILGFADGMDRLSRCNRLSPEKYIPFENTNLLFDPVW